MPAMFPPSAAGSAALNRPVGGRVTVRPELLAALRPLIARTRAKGGGGQSSAAPPGQPLPDADALSAAMMEAYASGDDDAVTALKELGQDPAGWNELLDDLDGGTHGMFEGDVSGPAVPRPPSPQPFPSGVGLAEQFDDGAEVRPAGPPDPAPTTTPTPAKWKADPTPKAPTRITRVDNPQVHAYGKTAERIMAAQEGGGANGRPHPATGQPNPNPHAVRKTERQGRIRRAGGEPLQKRTRADAEAAKSQLNQTLDKALANPGSITRGELGALERDLHLLSRKEVRARLDQIGPKMKGDKQHLVAALLAHVRGERWEERLQRGNTKRGLFESVRDNPHVTRSALREKHGKPEVDPDSDNGIHALLAELLNEGRIRQTNTRGEPTYALAEEPTPPAPSTSTGSAPATSPPATIETTAGLAGAIASLVSIAPAIAKLATAVDWAKVGDLVQQLSGQVAMPGAGTVAPSASPSQPQTQTVAPALSPEDKQIDPRERDAGLRNPTAQIIDESAVPSDSVATSASSPYSDTLYHGSRSRIVGGMLHPGGVGGLTTDAGNLGHAVYLTPDEHIARYYAGHRDENLHSVPVRLNNPIVLSGNKNEEAQKLAQKLGVTAIPEYDGTKQINPEWSKELARKAKEAGYDGVVWEKDGKVGEVAVFDPLPLASPNWSRNNIGNQSVSSGETSFDRMERELLPDDIRRLTVPDAPRSEPEYTGPGADYPHDSGPRERRGEHETSREYRERLARRTDGPPAWVDIPSRIAGERIPASGPATATPAPTAAATKPDQAVSEAISREILGLDKLDTEHVNQLREHLSNLTRPQLTALRQILDLKVGDTTDELRRQILAHAKRKWSQEGFTSEFAAGSVGDWRNLSVESPDGAERSTSADLQRAALAALLDAYHDGDDEMVKRLVSMLGGDPPEAFGFSDGPPGPPPRAGLKWRASTHRWYNPHTGEEHEHKPGHPVEHPRVEYTRAGAVVDGRRVMDSVPNQDSIYSSIDNPEILPGIREIPLSAFDPDYKPSFYSLSEKQRTEALAAKIKASRQISPLIIAIDREGPYVLEGGHRFDALHMLGAKSFPALVVVDTDSAGDDPAGWRWNYSPEQPASFSADGAEIVPPAYAPAELVEAILRAGAESEEADAVDDLLDQFGGDPAALDDFEDDAHANPFAPRGRGFSAAFDDGAEKAGWTFKNSARGNLMAISPAGDKYYGKKAKAIQDAHAAGNTETPHVQPHPGREAWKARGEANEARRVPAREAVARAVADPGNLTPADLDALRDHLHALRRDEVRKILDDAQGRGRGAKADLVDALLNHVRKGGKPATPAPTAATGADASDGGGVRNVHPGELKVDPKRFQFKLNTANPAGVTDELKTVKNWNPDFAGVLSTWRDPANGQEYVVNGHHRHELAHRLGVPSVAVRQIKAKNAVEARAKGALINIAEGRGTAVDAAKFMRDTGTTVGDFAAHGVPLKSGQLADQATALTRLSDKAFDRLVRGDLDQTRALAVAKFLPDHARQDKLFTLLDKRDDDDRETSTRTVEEMARAMAAVPDVTRTESTLWGPEETTDDVFVQRAELAGAVRADLAKELTDYATLASQRRAERTADAGNVLAVDENKKRADAAEKQKNLYDLLVNRKGAISDALNAGAVNLATAKTKKERERVRTATATAVRDAVRAEFEALDRGGKPAAADAGGEGGVVRGGGRSPEPAGGAGAGDGRGPGVEPGGLTPPDEPFTGTAANGVEYVNGVPQKRGEEPSSLATTPDGAEILPAAASPDPPAAGWKAWDRKNDTVHVREQEHGPFALYGHPDRGFEVLGKRGSVTDGRRHKTEADAQAAADRMWADRAAENSPADLPAAERLRLAPLATPNNPTTADHSDALEQIPPGQAAYVAGHHIRRLADGRFQIETGKSYATGHAGQIAKRIQDAWRQQAPERSAVEKALGRADAHTPPEWYDAAGNEAEAKRRAMIPAGARAVSLDPNTRGRTGSVVRNEATGQLRVQLDGGVGTHATDFEPLDSSHSWRVERKAGGAGPKAVQPGMFD